jgi:hypothetical protein
MGSIFVFTFKVQMSTSRMSLNAAALLGIAEGALRSTLNDQMMPPGCAASIHNIHFSNRSS